MLAQILSNAFKYADQELRVKSVDTWMRCQGTHLESQTTEMACLIASPLSSIRDSPGIGRLPEFTGHGLYFVKKHAEKLVNSGEDRRGAWPFDMDLGLN